MLGISLGPLEVASGEINRANTAIPCMRPAGGASIVEIGIENIFAMWPSRVAIVDDKCANYLARGRFSIGDVFTPDAGPNSIMAQASTRSALVAAAMSSAPASLIGAMIGRRATHSRRERERSFRRSGTKKAHSFIDRAQPFFHPPFRSSRGNDRATVVTWAQLFDVGCVKSGVLSRKIHLPNNGAGRHAFVLPCSNAAGGKRAKQTELDQADLNRKFDTR